MEFQQKFMENGAISLARKLMEFHEKIDGIPAKIDGKIDGIPAKIDG